MITKEQTLNNAWKKNKANIRKQVVDIINRELLNTPNKQIKQDIFV